MGRRFVERQHPRDSKGRFRPKGGGGAATVARRKSTSNAKRVLVKNVTGTGLKQNFTRAKAAYEVYNDVGDVVSNGSAAVAYGATGNYVKSGLHGAKASTAAYRLGSRAARSGILNSSVTPTVKNARIQRLNKVDDRVQTIDNVATIGLFLTGSRPPPRRSPKSGGAQGDFFTANMRGGRTGPRTPGKPKRTMKGPVYVITDAKKAAGGRVRR